MSAIQHTQNLTAALRDLATAFASVKVPPAPAPRHASASPSSAPTLDDIRRGKADEYVTEVAKRIDARRRR